MKRLFLFFALFFVKGFSFGQAVVEKVLRADEKASLKVRYIKVNDTVRFNFIEGIENSLNDAEKIELIDTLLKFEGDTTIHPGMTHPVYLRNSALNIYFTPKSNYFTIEINALYFINRIAFGIYCDYYSPAPVLYDKESGVEINDDPVKIKEVYKEYKAWFAKCKKAREIPKYFPFNSGRYVWLHGQESKFPKDGFFESLKLEMPEINP